MGELNLLMEMTGEHKMLKKLLFLILASGFMSAATAQAGDQTFANSREVSSKHSNGKTVAEFPDVAKTPEPPSGSLPIPYPNTGQSTDTTKGSKKVKTDRKPTMMKKSSFGRSRGDEPGSSESSTGTKKLKSLSNQIGLKNKQDLKEESE
jgi:hypothetical protein